MPDASFAPLWQPRCVSRPAPEDRCHLNGIAADASGQPRYVNIIGPGDVADGWRDHRAGGGQVIDVGANELVAIGLSMPHSPRLHNGTLYVLNSGTGEVGRVNLAPGRFGPTPDAYQARRAVGGSDWLGPIR